MISPKQLEELAHTLFASLPTSVQNMEKDVQEKFRDILQNTFHKLDLVTREEFDVQCKVLAKTRSKVENLQKELEKLLAQSTKKE